MAATASFRFPCSHIWPIGFGFRPTEEELITHYLKKKMLGHASLVQYIREIDLYNYEPWELPEQSLFESDNYEWFFFRAHTSKTRRTTAAGCWRTTGDDRPIKARGTNKVIGSRKILVFYQGRGSSAIRSKWVIHEYHLHPIPNQEWPFVVCRLKENAEERDELEHNRNRAIQEVTQMNRDNANVNANAYDDDCEVNIQLIQPEASDNEVDITELLNSVFPPDEYLDDASSSKTRSESALMDFQPEGEFNLSELLLNLNEVTTSNNHIDDEEVDNMVFELQYGFGSDTNNDTAFGGFPNNHISPNCVPEYTTRSTIKKSRRSPLTVKRFQCKDKEHEKPTDSNNGMKSEADNKATKSLPLVYVAKTFLGILMFLMFVQQLLHTH